MSGLTDLAAEDMAATAFDSTAPAGPADEITYTPETGAASTFYAVVGPEDLDDPDGGVSERHDVRFRRVIIQTSDIAVPSVVGKEKITFGGVDYGLTRIDWSNAAAWRGVFKRGRRSRLGTGQSRKDNV